MLPSYEDSQRTLSQSLRPKHRFLYKHSSLRFDNPPDLALASRHAKVLSCMRRVAQMTQKTQTFFNRHVRDDRRDSLEHILQKSGKNLVEALLEIQEYVTPELRSFDWAEELICLRLPNATITDRKRQARGSLQQTRISLFKANFSYAAVSYCCEPEDRHNVVPTYAVEDISLEKMRPARVRDTVLDRAIRFVQSCSSTTARLFSSVCEGHLRWASSCSSPELEQTPSRPHPTFHLAKRHLPHLHIRAVLCSPHYFNPPDGNACRACGRYVIQTLLLW